MVGAAHAVMGRGGERGEVGRVGGEERRGEERGGERGHGRVSMSTSATERES